MTSKTEEIALRLWKLKASTLELSNVNFTNLSYKTHFSDDEKSVGGPSTDSSKKSLNNTADANNNYSEDSPIKDDNMETNDEKKTNVGLKPTQSYIALIATAILKSKEKRLVLSEIYKYILDNYSHFQSQDKSWRNSIRHNLSLNECFIKVGRSEQGKGHYWAIHPANYEDFSQGDFRRRRARRRVRRSFFDNHPYTGYPLRPYANESQPMKGCTELYTNDSGAMRRKIYPLFYESQFYHTRKNDLESSGWRNKLLLTTTSYAKKSYHETEHYNSIKVPPTLIKVSTAQASYTSPRAKAFSIDSILGTKTKESDCCCSSPTCIQRYSRSHSNLKHCPY